MQTHFVRAARTALYASTVLAPALGAVPAAKADEAPPPLTVVEGHMPDPTVVGSRLSGQDLHEKGAAASDTAQVLARIAGVSANTGGGFSAMPAIRGLSEQRLRITVDGQPIDMACPNDMNSPLSYTNPQTLASLTVIPGVSPVSLGGDTIGGVIAAESAAPVFAKDGALLVTGSASGYYRSNGNAFGTSVSLTLAGENLSATYTGAYTQSDNYKAGGHLGTVHSSEYAKTDHALALALRTEAGLFELKGGYHYSPYEGFVNQSMDMTDNRSWFVQGRFRGEYDWGKADLSASYRDTDHTMNFLEDKLPGSMPMETRVHTFTSAVKFEIPAGEHHVLKTGLEYHHQWLNDWWPPVEGSMMMGPNAFVNINEGSRNRVGAYGEWTGDWTSNLTTTLGLRYDRVEMNTGDVAPYGTGMMQAADVAAAAAFNAADRRRTDNNWSGSALVRWTPSAALSLELGYAHKVRSPNLYERYTWGRGSMASRMIGWYGDGNGYVGDIALDPERADTFSAAFAVSPAKDVHLKVSPYYTHVNDYIDANVIGTLNERAVQLQFANTDAEFYGVDVSADAVLQGSAEQGTLLTATLAYVHGENTGADVPLYHQMPLNAALALTHRTGALELTGSVEWVDRKDRIDTRRNEPETSAYALVNLGAAYTLQGWRLGIEATNLFDKGYYLPLGGMALGDLAATDTWRPVAGQGRSVNLSISTAF
ncbi:TonB-dependent receptor [Novosphingobium mangrovi (ex Hu et al. 2023)]|uniref:TonB-dependent receptor n=1 Tax=Novosphingobium mangrovi (ex Hu et al. 2023) TaxID=2930094 RepID=A0ABT0A7F8_9SPHN|nr:TonB-dependent receptor [Novosphingobium mangrovi (ex Hu et al. 2023)]MCJ1959132.1 TonB-dependent receptor [Novosphingobium mangrovi (ex Hu et al. 2023)]